MNIFTKYQGQVKTDISINANQNKVYNIHLNPNATFFTGGSYDSPFNNPIMVYKYDFSTMPQGKYKVTFTYVGEFQRIRGEGFNKEDFFGLRPYIFCDLGQHGNSFMPDNRINNNNFRHQSTTLLGVLQHRENPIISENIYGDNSSWDVNFFSATDQNNPAIYLNNRPTGEQIDITITEYDTNTNSFSRWQFNTIQAYNQNYNRFIKDYHMTLHFELLEEV